MSRMASRGQQGERLGLDLEEAAAGGLDRRHARRWSAAGTSVSSGPSGQQLGWYAKSRHRASNAWPHRQAWRPWRPATPGLPDRARLDGRGAGAGRGPLGARRPSGRSRTSRSPAGAIDRRADRARWPASRARRPTVNARLGGDRPQDVADRHRTTPPPRWPTGERDDHFPIDVFQTGSGTSSNMNINEVHRHASRPSGSAGRSTPTTTSTRRSRRTTCSRRPSTSPSSDAVVDATCCPRSSTSRSALRAKAAASSPTVVKSGRTHLMDATPVTLGQEFGGYAAQVDEARRAPPRDAARRRRAAARRHRGRHRHQRPEGLRRATSSSGWPSDIGPAAHRGARPLRRPGRPRRAGRAVRASCARSPSRSSRSPTTSAGWARGPRTGLAEIRIPDLQPGSSIMPGKVNPVLAEAVTQVAAQVIGNDAAVAFAGIAGQLRAQRVPAGDGPQPARVDPAAGQRRPGCSPTAASPASRPTSSAAAPTPSRARRSARRSTRTSATRRRPRSSRRA